MGADVSSSGHSIQITANEISLSGTLDSGVAQTGLQDSDGTGIGFGGTTVTNGLNVSDAFLDSVTAASLSLETSGDITVDGITQPTGIAGAVSLSAAGTSSTVTFQTSASSFHTLDVDASDGITVSSDVSATTGGITLNADSDGVDNTGTLTINGAALSTTNQTISITADDVAFAASSSVSSGTANVLITDSDGTGINLGGSGGTGTLDLTDTEMGFVAATDLQLFTIGAVSVDGISQSATITGEIFIDAEATIAFENNDSTFLSLTAESDDLISVNVNVTTTAGDLDLNGDANASTDTTIKSRWQRNDIVFRRIALAASNHIWDVGGRGVDTPCE